MLSEGASRVVLSILQKISPCELCCIMLYYVVLPPPLFFCSKCSHLASSCHSCSTENMPEIQRIVRQAMDDWEAKTCLQFVERDKEADYITFFRGSQ